MRIGLTFTETNNEGELVPLTGLQQNQITFVKASDNITVIGYNYFSETGEGNYVVGGFIVPPYDPFDPIHADSGTEEVKVKLNGNLQNGFGIISVFADGDETVSRSYVDGRVDRDGDTCFAFISYDNENWRGGTPLTEPGDYNLIHKKYVYDKDAERVDRAGDTIQGWITIDRENWNGSTNYDDPSDYNLVYKKWIVDNFPVSGQSGNFWKINTNRIIVDSRTDRQFTEKIYFKVQDAIAYATTQSPSATSRWEIFIFPHHSSGYAEDITLPRWVSLIGIGKVVVAGGLEVAQPENWVNYDAKIENLIFKVNDRGYTIRQMRVNNCLFHANGVSGEVNLIINGSQCNNTGFFVQNDVNLETLNTNKINRIQGCYGNAAITWQTNDKVYSYDYLEGDVWE